MRERKEEMSGSLLFTLSSAGGGTARHSVLSQNHSLIPNSFQTESLFLCNQSGLPGGGIFAGDVVTL